MRSGLSRRLWPLAVVGALAAAAPAVLHVAFGDSPVSFTGETHAYAVGFSALVAACAASGLTILGARRADTRTVLVGTAFAVMAALLALHGFATPGVWFGAERRRRDHRRRDAAGRRASSSRSRRSRYRAGCARAARCSRSRRVLIAVVVGLGLSALAWPSLLPPVPAPNSPAALALLVVGLVAYGLLALRALRTFLLTQRRSTSSSSSGSSGSRRRSCRR